MQRPPAVENGRLPFSTAAVSYVFLLTKAFVDPSRPKIALPYSPRLSLPPKSPLSLPSRPAGRGASRRRLRGRAGAALGCAACGRGARRASDRRFAARDPSRHRAPRAEGPVWLRRRTFPCTSSGALPGKVRKDSRARNARPGQARPGRAAPPSVSALRRASLHDRGFEFGRRNAVLGARRRVLAAASSRRALLALRRVEPACGSSRRPPSLAPDHAAALVSARIAAPLAAAPELAQAFVLSAAGRRETPVVAGVPEAYAGALVDEKKTFVEGHRGNLVADELFDRGKSIDELFAGET